MVILLVIYQLSIAKRKTLASTLIFKISFNYLPRFYALFEGTVSEAD